MKRNDFISAASTDMVETPQLFYVDGFKYQSRNDMVYFTGIFPPKTIVTELIILRTDSWMWVGKYFAWDGCSGPTIDTNTNGRGGHAHDALAALMRGGYIPMGCRFASNKVIERLMIDDGAWECRAHTYRFVLDRTKSWADPKNARKLLTAPHKIKIPGLSPA